MAPFSVLWNKWRAYIYKGDHPEPGPHFHLRHAGEDLVVDINTGEVFGCLPGKERRQLRRWVVENRDKLLSNWERMQRGELPEWIPFQ